MKLKKKYYRLEEVAKEWDCTVMDLLDYAEQGLLIIRVRPENLDSVMGQAAVGEGESLSARAICYYLTSEHIVKDNLFPVDPGTISLVKKMAPTISSPIPRTFQYPVLTFVSLVPETSSAGMAGVQWWIGRFNIDEMLITQEEKERREAESKGIIHVTDEELATMPEELSCALNCWRALYRDGEMKEKRGHKEQIEEWLKKNTRLGTTAIDRVATVVNQRKRGGALPIE